MVDSNSPLSDTALPTSLITPLRNGSLTFENFSALSSGQASLIVKLLATGSRDQRTNLILLMAHSRFSDVLIDSLNDMQTKERIVLLQTIGEEPEEEIKLCRLTLWAALDKIVHSRLHDTLRAVLLGQDSGAIREINAYLVSGIDKSLYFIRTLAFDQSVDDKGFAQAYLSLSFDNRLSAMKSLSSSLNEDSCDLFKRFCDVIYDSQQEALRSKIEKAIDALSDIERNALLTHIILDPDGNRSSDRQANKAQRFVATYCERKGRNTLLQWISSLPSEVQPKWNLFLFFNVHNYDTMISLVDGANGSGQSGFVKDLVRTGAPISKRILYASIVGKIGGGIASVALGQPYVIFPLVFSVADDVKNLRQHEMLKLPPVNIPNSITVMVANFLSKPPWFGKEKTAARQEISMLLQHGYIHVLLHLKPSEIKNLIKVFINSPCDMTGLKCMLATLPPQLSAKLARSVSAAFVELVADAKTGSAIGDILKGLTITGKLGYSSSRKSGEAKAQSTENAMSISAEVGFSWTPSALVDGNRTRELNNLMAELNSFMSDWMIHLNAMTPNQKYIFLEEMKDSVKIELKI